MDRVIVDFRPFSMCQNISVYVDGACKQIIGIDMDNIVPTVKALCEQYNINHVDMCGNANFISKYKEELMATQYGQLVVDTIEH